ncbi:MAG: type II CAAX endopeptidase family protein [Cyclobacteriaceae bacterium]
MSIEIQKRSMTLPVFIGLLISLFSLTFFAIFFRDWFGISPMVVLVRELLIFSFVGILVWIIYRWEQLTLQSISLHADSIKRSLFRSLLFFVLSALGIAACLLIMQPLGWTVGGNDAHAYKDVPLWIFFVVVLRAGIAEEVFYRGYAIERISAITGSKWVAAMVPLVIFSIGHFRQGPAGILISFVVGGILTLTYLWKKDLLANMIAHFLIDFIPNILLPALGANE